MYRLRNRRIRLDTKFDADDLNIDELVRIIDINQKERTIGNNTVNNFFDVILDIIKFLIGLSVPALVTSYAIQTQIIDLERLRFFIVVVLVLSVLILVILLRIKWKITKPYIDSSTASIKLITEINKNWLLRNKIKEKLRK